MLGRKLNSAMPVLLVSLLTSVGCSTVSLQKVNPLASKDERADSQMSLARLYERKNQPQQAEQLYRQILAKDPKNQDAHHRMGVLMARQNRFDESQKHFETAMSFGTAKVELLNDVGYSLYLQDRLPEAEQVLRKSLAQSPQNRTAMNNLGLVLGQQGRMDETFALFKQAGGEAEAYANMAYIHAMQADLQNATRDYGRALTLNPDLRTAAKGAVQIAAQQRQRENLTAQRMAEQRRMMPGAPQGPPSQALAGGQRSPMGEPAIQGMPSQQQPLSANPATALAEVLPGREFPVGRTASQDKVVTPAQTPLLPVEPSQDFETVASSDRQNGGTPAPGMTSPAASEIIPPVALAEANAPATAWPKVEPIMPASPVLAPEHRPGPPLVLHAGPADGDIAVAGDVRESNSGISQVNAGPLTSESPLAGPAPTEPAAFSQSSQAIDNPLPAAVSNAGADMFGSLSSAVTTAPNNQNFGIERTSYVATQPAPMQQTASSTTRHDAAQQGVERAFAEIITNNQPPVQPAAVTNNRRMAMGNLFTPTQQPQGSSTQGTTPRYLPVDNGASAIDLR